MNVSSALACALAATVAAACAGSAPTTAPSRSTAPTAAPNPSPAPSAAPSPSQAPPPSARPVPSEGRLSAGRYLYDHGQFAPVAFTFTVPDGWKVESGGAIVTMDKPEPVGFSSAILDSVNADACAQETPLIDAGTTVDDLVDALLDQSGPSVEGPFDITVGGYAGLRLDVTAPPEAELSGCNAPDALQLWSDEAGNHAVVFASWETSVYAIEVAGERVVLMTVHENSSPADDVSELRAVIESIEFKAP